MCKFIALVAMGLFIASSAFAHSMITVEHLPGGGGSAYGSVAAGIETGGSVDCFTVGGGFLCRIVEAGGEQAFCSGSDPDQLAAVRGLPDNACIWIAFNGAGECTAVITATGTHSHPATE